jgi:hypothetical protein
MVRLRADRLILGAVLLIITSGSLPKSLNAYSK